jgi:hypothetical protein
MANNKECEKVLGMQKEYTEKRRLDRFDISAPAWIDLPCTRSGGRMSKARVLNISSNGAFLKLNDDTIDENEEVELSILISVKKLSELFGIDDHVLLKVGGKVLRRKD